MIADDTPVMLDPGAVEAIFNDAKAQAAQIIHEAEEHARAQGEIARITAEVANQEVRRAAYQEGQSTGYTEGAAAKVNQIEQCLTQMEELIGTMEGTLDGFITQYESDLKWAAAEIAGKVLHRIIQRDELELTEMVKLAVDQVKDQPWIDLHLSATATELIDRLGRELAPIRQLEIVPGDLPAGSCILDLPDGKLDASIDAQLENLRDYFKFHGSGL